MADRAVPMKLHAGTSGYAYPAWKGPFYPADLPDAQMLRHYAGQLDTVEINNTFYRMPKSSVVEAWAAEVPDHFRFVLKASRRITHDARLKEEAAESVAYLFKVAAALKDKLGPVLFQLPPNLKKDLPRLEAFLALLPPAPVRAAFEFRNTSWLDEEVYALLRRHGAALCAADFGDGPEIPLVPTANWGYLRLRRPSYEEAEIAEWAARIKAQPWEEAFVYFMHEDDGLAPGRARTLAAFFEAA